MRAISRRRLLASAWSGGLTLALPPPARAGVPSFLWSQTSRHLPSTQTVGFGAKTLVGCGGHPLGYSGAGILSIAAGNGLGHWAIDDQNCLVPFAGGGYAAAPPAFLTGLAAYVLTVIELNGAGNPTGQSSVVTVNMLANAAHVRDKRFGANADSVSSFQLQKLLTKTSTGALAGGETVYVRDGITNPDAQKFGFNVNATAAWVVSGNTVVVVSENPDNSTDVNGHAVRGGAGKFNYLKVSISADVPLPLEFRDLTFIHDDAGSIPAFLMRVNNGGGVKLTRCRFECGPNVPAVNTLQIDGAYAPGIGPAFTGLNVQSCYFKRCGVSITLSGLNPTSQWNVFEGTAVDDHRLTDCVGPVITDNFFFNKVTNLNLDANGNPRSHPDDVQDTFVGDVAQATRLGTIAGGTIARNISKPRGPELISTNQDTHFILVDDAYGGASQFVNDANATLLNAPLIENNIANHCDDAFIQLNSTLDAMVRHNTGTYVYGVNVATFLAPGIKLVDSHIKQSGTGTVWTSQGARGTIARNICHQVSVGTHWASTGGGVTQTNNLIKNRLDSDYGDWLDSLFTGGKGAVSGNTRLAMIDYRTPLEGSVAANGDGTYSGALFPKPSGYAHAPWNDGSVYLPNDSAWRLAHPPAS